MKAHQIQPGHIYKGKHDSHRKVIAVADTSVWYQDFIENTISPEKSYFGRTDKTDMKDFLQWARHDVGEKTDLVVLCQELLKQTHHAKRELRKAQG